MGCENRTGNMVQLDLEVVGLCNHKGCYWPVADSFRHHSHHPHHHCCPRLCLGVTHKVVAGVDKYTQMKGVGVVGVKLIDKGCHKKSTLCKKFGL